MSVLVYTESENGIFKKTAFEAVSYAKGLADALNTTVTAVSINGKDTEQLGKYGADKVLDVSNDALKTFKADAYAEAITQAAKKEETKVVILSSTTDSKYLAPLLAVNLEAGYVPNVVALPTSTSPFTVKHNVFSNKAFAETEIKTEVKLLAVATNAYSITTTDGTAAVQSFETNLDNLKDVEVIEIERSTDKVSIADAEVVVSGGRGLKGPENWHLIEDLAEVLGAATACSKPVSDMGWRPHEEHVGQTGRPVASNLYIAIGISGAIQHLAGVSASKVKVVINNDPEAPFFKAAEYGIVGDAFEIVPELIEKLKVFKAENA